MADTITFRPDEDASRALAVLTRDGTPVSTAVRAALIDAACERARSALRAEAKTLAADEHDRAEAAQVLRDMEPPCVVRCTDCAHPETPVVTNSGARGMP